MKKNKKPRYQIIKDHILNNIKNKTFTTGKKIPTELELTKQFKVSRMTVNRAIRDLVTDGILKRYAGDGSYVSEQSNEIPKLQIVNIAEEIRARGHQYRNEIVVADRVSADEKIAENLQVKPGVNVYHTVILHRENDVAVQLEDRYVNAQVAPEYMEQNFSKTTPNHYLTEHFPLSDVEHIIKATLADDLSQKLLHIGKHEPCIQVNRRTWSSGQLISCAKLIYPGSRYKLYSRSAY